MTYTVLVYQVWYINFFGRRNIIPCKYNACQHFQDSGVSVESQRDSLLENLESRVIVTVSICFFSSFDIIGGSEKRLEQE